MSKKSGRKKSVDAVQEEDSNMSDVILSTPVRRTRSNIRENKNFDTSDIVLPTPPLIRGTKRQMFNIE
jgi:hypothetical protein